MVDCEIFEMGNTPVGLIPCPFLDLAGLGPTGNRTLRDWDLQGIGPCGTGIYRE
jgi:hypothetical protein